MSVPFNDFSMELDLRGKEHKIVVYPRLCLTNYEARKEQLEFIEKAIREKMEREKWH